MQVPKHTSDTGVKAMSVYSPSGSGEVHVDKVISGGNMPWEVRMDEGRHCVYKKGTNSKIGCHETHAQALEQVQALYAREGGKMGENLRYIVSLSDVKLEGDSTWIHALPFGQYKHPVFGVIDASLQKINALADSVKKKVRGIDPSINLNHDNDSADGAAAWVKDSQVRSDGLWLFVEFVKDIAEKVREKKFKYFSLEFADKWEDPQGKEFDDVVIGGALTNRPFMKNLVPINLSESVIDNAFDLVSGITGKDVTSLKEGTNMDQKDLQAIIDGVTTKLAELNKPPVIEDKTPVAKLEEIEEFRKLAEANPVAKSLLVHFETQAKAIADGNKRMRETLVDSRLSEFDNDKMALTPSAKELAREIMLGMNEELTGKFVAFLENVRTSTNFMVELGERSGAAVRHNYSMGEKSATQEFSERTNKLMLDEKLDFLTAVEKVASADPTLYERYRMGDGAQASK